MKVLADCRGKVTSLFLSETVAIHNQHNKQTVICSPYPPYVGSVRVSVYCTKCHNALEKDPLQGFHLYKDLSSSVSCGSQYKTQFDSLEAVECIHSNRLG